MNTLNFVLGQQPPSNFGPASSFRIRMEYELGGPKYVYKYIQINIHIQI